jgi:hypothetical protein
MDQNALVQSKTRVSGFSELERKRLDEINHFE